MSGVVKMYCSRLTWKGSACLWRALLLDMRLGSKVLQEMESGETQAGIWALERYEDSPEVEDVTILQLNVDFCT